MISNSKKINVGSVYLTSNMNQTAKWFEEVLGWYTGVEVRDTDGNPTYGCSMPFSGDWCILE